MSKKTNYIHYTLHRIYNKLFIKKKTLHNIHMYMLLLVHVVLLL